MITSAPSERIVDSGASCLIPRITRLTSFCCAKVDQRDVYAARACMSSGLTSSTDAFQEHGLKWLEERGYKWKKVNANPGE